MDEQGRPANVPVQGILQGTFAAELQNHPRLRHLALCSISTLQLLPCMPLHTPQAAHQLLDYDMQSQRDALAARSSQQHRRNLPRMAKFLVIII